MVSHRRYVVAERIRRALLQRRTARRRRTVVTHLLASAPFPLIRPKRRSHDANHHGSEPPGDEDGIGVAYPAPAAGAPGAEPGRPGHRHQRADWPGGHGGRRHHGRLLLLRALHGGVDVLADRGAKAFRSLSLRLPALPRQHRAAASHAAHHGRPEPPDGACRLAQVADKSTLRLTHYGRKTGKPYEVTMPLSTAVKGAGTRRGRSSPPR